MAKRNNLIIANFIEELGWLLKNYTEVNLPSELQSYVRSHKPTMSEVDEFTPANPNIAFLVGALPALFMNREFFPLNEDIAKFANKILHINIKRYDKRSQYELIGLIVCEVLKLDDAQLSAVVKELKRIVPAKGSPAKGVIDWNTAIRRLSGEEQS